MDDNTIKKQMIDIDARGKYIKLIKAELLGPGSEFAIPDAEHELISSNPINRYSVGILYPQGSRIGQDNDETIPLGAKEDGEIAEIEKAEEELPTKRRRNFEFDKTANENLDEEIGLSTQYMPSSMGMTFIAKGNTDVVSGNVSFATYRKAKDEKSEIIIPLSQLKPKNSETYEVPKSLEDIMTYDKERSVIRLRSDLQVSKVKTIFGNPKDITEEDFDRIKQITYHFAYFCQNGYVRKPHSEKFTLKFSQEENCISSDIESEGASIQITALRTKISEGVWSLTVMLVNNKKETSVDVRHCIFQPKIEIKSEENKFVFGDFSEVHNDAEMDKEDKEDKEERALELLYREHKVYGTGLGVAVDWDIDHKNGNGRIWSDFFPEAEVPQMDFNLPEKDFQKKYMSMKYLSDLSEEADKDEKLERLRNLVDLYKNWVSELEKKATELDPRYKDAAKANIKECKSAYERMYSGIETLKNNDNAYAAFELANRAMFMQRVHLRMQSKTANKDRYPGDEEIAELLKMDYRTENDSDCFWRPFQLAFLLMDINSVVDDKSDDRNIVDLIWFPTGGGKTEAYLGLTAFTIFYRRLTHPDTAGGTAVIMRYTLRLLAAQQFTRAATLICACEFIRKDCKNKKAASYPFYEIGKHPITIGLWIGREHTPNNNTNGKGHDAKAHIDELRKVKWNSVEDIKDKHNKFQVLKCPWCGTKLVKDSNSKDKKLVGDWGYEMRDEKYFFLHCTHEHCYYNKELPIQVVDEELYKTPPTLLFGTVDKFAMLPWNYDQVGELFGKGVRRAPELIIQDELHLISGALGTIVGLYETAVDAICAQGGVRPKIIASTATIRRAKEQCSVLYNREVVQFPAPGLNAEDSFFAREDKISFGRKYVGIMPSGKTKATTETRAIAALLQKVSTMELPEEIKDKLWTLTVYFNSLKDLGKASTLVDDAVKEQIVRTANRMLEKRRLIVVSDELTSRVTTTELNKTLDKLEKVEYSQENIDAKRYASNILLATNMISVGIDIARLNVMLMVGQPKLTSEYIQASSRVGRSFPGVAFVQYDATKSRDRSHYEQFKAYHESFYRFVEPTGATPFSKPARERALHAVLTAMYRQRAGLCDDKEAIDFDMEKHSDIVTKIKSFVMERIRDINKRHATDDMQYDIDKIEQEIDRFFEEWQRKVKDAKEETDGSLFFGLGHMFKSPKPNEQLLLKTFDSAKHILAFETLTSMRNVDSQVEGEILIWEEK